MPPDQLKQMQESVAKQTLLLKEQLAKRPVTSTKVSVISRGDYSQTGQ